MKATLLLLLTMLSSLVTAGHPDFKDLIECEPWDEIETKMVCDNTYGEFAMTCSYTRGQVGTIYTAELAWIIEMSEDVADLVEGELAEVYATGIGISASTGFDWTTAKDETFEEAVTSDVSVTVLPGTKVSIEQVTGYCGDNISLTEFLTTTESACGNREVTHHKKEQK